jgi:hypothetical protein
MATTQGYSAIDDIVREECLAQEDYNLSKYMRYLSFALEAVRDWTVDKKNEVKVLVSNTSAIATLAFPTDYVKWSRIGTLEGDRIKTMIVNNKLNLYHDGATNNTPYRPSYASLLPGNDPYYQYSINYDTSGAIYGFGNGGYLNDGEFRVDRENRRFQFSSIWASTQVYLEYVGTGLNPTGATVVDEIARKCIKFYIRWQALETSRTASLGEKQRAEEKYWEANLEASKRSLDVDLDKILGISREAYKTTPKY